MSQLQKFVDWKSAALAALLGIGDPLAAAAQPAPAPREGIPTLSGYMEVHLNKEQDLPAEVDLHRFVLMVGHSFTDRLKFWSEIEVEHAFVEVEGGEETGEVAIEQAFIDFGRQVLLFVEMHLLERAGARVTEFFTRAQSIMCLEKVSLQRLSVSFGAEGPSRFVESELRVSWAPTAEDPTPKEARTLRQVLRVNGGTPRKKDLDNCTTPEQQTSEPQPLSILLPAQRGQYTFTFDRTETLDGRSAIVIAYREIKKPTVDVSLVDGKEDCISFDIDGGMRGRIWIDAETHDVLRLDKNLAGLVEIPLPWRIVRRGGQASWTMERWDESIRFKRVTFQDPEETLVLPVSSTILQITRGAGTPRLRTSTQYLAYRRFMTGARVVPPS